MGVEWEWRGCKAVPWRAVCLPCHERLQVTQVGSCCCQQLLHCHSQWPHWNTAVALGAGWQRHQAQQARVCPPLASARKTATAAQDNTIAPLQRSHTHTLPEHNTTTQRWMYTLTCSTVRCSSRVNRRCKPLLELDEVLEAIIIVVWGAGGFGGRLEKYQISANFR